MARMAQTLLSVKRAALKKRGVGEGAGLHVKRDDKHYDADDDSDDMLPQFVVLSVRRARKAFKNRRVGGICRHDAGMPSPTLQTDCRDSGAQGQHALLQRCGGVGGPCSGNLQTYDVDDDDDVVVAVVVPT